jgi:hypothetical protein
MHHVQSIGQVRRHILRRLQEHPHQPVIINPLYAIPFLEERARVRGSL